MEADLTGILRLQVLDTEILPFEENEADFWLGVLCAG